MQNKKENKTLISFFARIIRKELRTEEKVLFNDFEENLLAKNKNQLFKSDIEKRRIREDIFSEIDSKTRTNKNIWWSVAASVVILFGLGLGYHESNKDDFPTVEYANNSGSVENVELIDGSIISLKNNSVLLVSGDFNDKQRNVILKGEAFFDIARDENRPFIITTGELKTQVLGTSFNIKESINDIKVTVASGLVKVFNDEHSTKITPNQQAIFDIKQGGLQKRSLSKAFSKEWFNDDVLLDNISMNDLSDFMDMRYNMKLEFFEESLKTKRLSLDISGNTTKEKIVKHVNFVNEVKLQIVDNKIMVSKK